MHQFDALQPYSFTCKITHNHIVTPQHISWAIGLMHRVAKVNGNTEWNRRVGCITDSDEEILRHLSITQAIAYQSLPTAFKDLGATWQRSRNGNYTAAIWLRANQTPQTYVDTLAHELAHVVTRSVHGWVWRRMCIILTPLIRAHIYYDMSQLDDVHVRECAETVVTYYGSRQRSSTGLLPYQRQNLEIEKHVVAAKKMHAKFIPYLNIKP